MTHEEAIAVLEGLKSLVYTDDMDGTLRAETNNAALDMAIEAIGLIENRAEHFKRWAIRDKAHVCATCKRNSANRAGDTACPIEHSYALVLDGHCHLWEPVTWIVPSEG